MRSHRSRAAHIAGIAGITSLALLGACSPDAAPPGVAGQVAPPHAQATASQGADPAPSSLPAPSGAAPVLLVASASTGTFNDAPACMVNFQATNRGTLPLAVFSASVLPVRADSGQALETVGIASVGVAGLDPERPLQPGVQGKPWPLNVKGAACDQVRIRFDRFLCAFAGQPCSAIAVEHQGLAGMDAPTLAKK